MNRNRGPNRRGALPRALAAAVCLMTMIGVTGMAAGALPAAQTSHDPAAMKVAPSARPDVPAGNDPAPFEDGATQEPGPFAAAGDPPAGPRGLKEMGAAEPAGLFRVTAGLLVTVAVVLIVAAILKRTPAGRAPGGLKLESRLPVGRGSALAVVQAEGRRLLVGITQNQISYMTDLPEGPKERSSVRAGSAGAFEKIYKAVVTRAGGLR